MMTEIPRMVERYGISIVIVNGAMSVDVRCYFVNDGTMSVEVTL